MGVSQLSGQAAECWWGYYKAAGLGAWTVTRAEFGTWTLTATVLTPDAFRMQQRPLTFVARHANGTWRWPILTMDPDGGPNQLRATLGAPAP